MNRYEKQIIATAKRMKDYNVQDPAHLILLHIELSILGVYFAQLDKPECDHADTDDHTCLNCGKDLTEDRAAQAFDHMKDERKYGV